jgi:hypothetical protein
MPFATWAGRFLFDGKPLSLVSAIVIKKAKVNQSLGLPYFQSIKRS